MIRPGARRCRRCRARKRGRSPFFITAPSPFRCRGRGRWFWARKRGRSPFFITAPSPFRCRGRGRWFWSAAVVGFAVDVESDLCRGVETDGCDVREILPCIETDGGRAAGVVQILHGNRVGGIDRVEGDGLRFTRRSRLRLRCPEVGREAIGGGVRAVMRDRIGVFGRADSGDDRDDHKHQRQLHQRECASRSHAPSPQKQPARKAARPAPFLANRAAQFLIR
jgi:hypothetical protein